MAELKISAESIKTRRGFDFSMEHTMQKLLILLTILLYPLGGLAQGPSSEKDLLDAKILFDGRGKAQVSYNTHGQSPEDTATNKLQSAMIFYAYAMNRLPEEKRVPFMNEVQKIVGKIATEDGIQKADILLGNPMVVKVGPAAKGKGYDLDFGAIAGKGNSLQVKPLPDSDEYLEPSVFYLFQDLINSSPDSGLRLMALSLGGMNKWYREKGKASDPNSVSQAPAYGLNLAVDIISKLSGQKI